MEMLRVLFTVNDSKEEKCIVGSDEEIVISRLIEKVVGEDKLKQIKKVQLQFQEDTEDELKATLTITLDDCQKTIVHLQNGGIIEVDC